MFDYINCPWLEPEINDVIRLYDAQNERFGHYFEFSSGNFINHVEYGGQIYDFKNYADVEDQLEYKRYAKRYAKLAFYNVLKEAKGIEMPYGALTGIRPTKLAYTEMAAGRNFRALFKELGVREDNIEHVAKVIETQREIYSDAGGQDLFISLPFCPTKCDYCSFITAPLSAVKNLVDPYICLVEREIEAVKGLLKRPKSVYIGGGTPFAVDEKALGRILCAVQSLGLPSVEFTVEAGRPDSFTKEKLELCKEYGVTRICVNPQTFKDETLIKIGRKHTAADALKAYAQAREYGFCINVDLIAGLEGESADDFKNSLKRTIELQPENITVHTLSLKAGAKLKERCSRLEVEDIGKMIAVSRELLCKAGYLPYYMYRQKYQAGGWENCGWCKKGTASVYNVDVMEEIADNVAVGANAISKRVFEEGERIERLASPKDIPTYLAKADKIIAERDRLFA